MGYLFLLPLFISFFVYSFYPKMTSIWWSFTDFRFLVPEQTRFIGLGNFIEAFQDEMLWIGARNAVYFALLAFAGRIVPALLVAVVLDRARSVRFVNLCRVLYYIPSVVPGPLIFMLWNFIYAPSYGLLNGILVDRLHLFNERPLWLLSPSLLVGLVSFAAVGWWMSLGGAHMLLFSVGLGNISKELYEAARIDGASEVQIIIRIMVPLLKHYFFVASLWTMGAFGVLTDAMLMSPQGTNGIMWATYAYQQAFNGYMRMGYSSAIGLIFGGMLTIFTSVLWKVFRTERH